jgi:murein DD-endopeptidase MepM/ murein hydrolase activator NlpD
MIQIQPKKRTSHPISKFFRPVFEKRNIKAAFGGLISMTTLASGMFILPGDQSAMASANLQPFDQEVVIETKRSLVNVLPINTGVSQEFHVGHAGIDITAILGSKIYPIKEGVVILMTFTRWDYGRSVVVDHGNGLQTRYAHMGKVFVEEGEKVTTDMPIGEVGMTGRTTGPHLHLEILKEGRNVNPRNYLTLDKGRVAKAK